MSAFPWPPRRQSVGRQARRWDPAPRFPASHGRHRRRRGGTWLAAAAAAAAAPRRPLPVARLSSSISFRRRLRPARLWDTALHLLAVSLPLCPPPPLLPLPSWPQSLVPPHSPRFSARRRYRRRRRHHARHRPARCVAGRQCTRDRRRTSGGLPGRRLTAVGSVGRPGRPAARRRRAARLEAGGGGGRAQPAAARPAGISPAGGCAVAPSLGAGLAVVGGGGGQCGWWEQWR